MSAFDDKKRIASEWFSELREQIIAELLCVEKEYSGCVPAVSRRQWQRPDGGGGEAGVICGQVFEKAGVNYSLVCGKLSEGFGHEIPGAADSDRNFWASGISLVIHPRSPLVPVIHMNTRMIITSKGWFGGGMDLTPTYPNDKDTAFFHENLESVCVGYDKDCYAKFKKECDEYFFLKHRNEPRGVGGIFYDYLDSGDWERDFLFTQKVGQAFLHIYPTIVRCRMNETWEAEQREYQLVKRGRYVEFNLIYDRGTRFGLMTGGDTDAIMMSMPPLVKWG